MPALPTWIFSCAVSQTLPSSKPSCASSCCIAMTMTLFWTHCLHASAAIQGFVYMYACPNRCFSTCGGSGVVFWRQIVDACLHYQERRCKKKFSGMSMWAKTRMIGTQSGPEKLLDVGVLTSFSCLIFPEYHTRS